MGSAASTADSSSPPPDAGKNAASADSGESKSPPADALAHPHRAADAVSITPSPDRVVPADVFDAHHAGADAPAEPRSLLHDHSDGCP